MSFVEQEKNNYKKEKQYEKKENYNFKPKIKKPVRAFFISGHLRSS